MWQEVLAVDSKLAQFRMTTSAADRELRPVYLKRRMQLLQQQQQQQQQNELLSGAQDPDCGGGGGGPVRNRRYISLRVKLLKRQFGLPNEVLSLKSMSMASSQQATNTTSSRSPANNNQDLSNSAGVNAVDPSSGLVPHTTSSSSRFSYSGVSHIFDQHREAITRVVFTHNDDKSFICSSMDGTLSLCELGPDPKYTSLVGHSEGVLDCDISESNELCVSCSLDGNLILWDLKTRTQLRCVKNAGAYLFFCKFLPRNNNLVVCGLNSGAVRIMNISTGKFHQEGSPLLGKSLCSEINSQGSVLWVGNDRGYVESFRLMAEQGGKVQKGCRCRLSSSPTTPDPVTSITSHACLSKISKNHTVLLVNVSSDCLHLLRVIDDFGSVEPFLKFGQQSSALGRGGGAALGGGMAASGGSKRFPVLRCSAFAPIIGSSEGTCAVSGSEDGSLCFFDLERELKKLPPCVNKLLGHSKPVISLGFSHNENFLASADSSGQIIVWKK